MVAVPIKKDYSTDNPYDCPAWESLACEDGRDGICDGCDNVEQYQEAKQEDLTAGARTANLLSGQLPDDYTR